MEPQALVEAREKAEASARKERQRLCKAAIVETEQLKADYEVSDFVFGLKRSGCPNERRNGSAWCQACSDAHKASSNH